MNRPSAQELIRLLTDARARTLELVGDLSDEQLMGPRLSIVNPLRWEIGHIAWFQENWVLRHLRKERPIRDDGDMLYDSAAVPHDTRWDLPLPSRGETLRLMQTVLDRVLERLGSTALDEEVSYFHLLALCHEDMHAEAITYTRQTLSYPRPEIALAKDARPPETGGPLFGDVEIPGGVFMLGATPNSPFVFDNEKWAHPVEVRRFRIARAPVTNAEFLQFVEDAGYERREFWSEEGWRWQEDTAARHPAYWQHEANGRWLTRSYDQSVRLKDHHPVIHVSWYEADAYCRWAGRRLPTELEWEAAASATSKGDSLSREKREFPWGDDPHSPNRANLDSRLVGLIDVAALPDSDSGFGCRQMIGNVWEWTATDFSPYPGFVVDPYKEYSEPWFGSHKVLRGGCWATRSRLIRNSWRNFYTPDRRDVFAGFRTCALVPWR